MDSSDSGPDPKHDPVMFLVHAIMEHSKCGCPHEDLANAVIRALQSDAPISKQEREYAERLVVELRAVYSPEGGR